MIGAVLVILACLGGGILLAIKLRMMHRLMVVETQSRD